MRGVVGADVRPWTDLYQLAASHSTDVHVLRGPARPPAPPLTPELRWVAAPLFLEHAGAAPFPRCRATSLLGLRSLVLDAKLSYLVELTLAVQARELVAIHDGEHDDSGEDDKTNDEPGDGATVHAVVIG